MLRWKRPRSWKRRKSTGLLLPVKERITIDIQGRPRQLSRLPDKLSEAVREVEEECLPHPLAPFLLRLIPRDEGGSICSVKVAPDNIADSIASIRKAFQSFFADGTFSYQFLDEDFQQMYLEERKAGRVVAGLALIAILIACLGLFGLSSYMTKQRVLEIGIRKVMGASSTNISWLLSWQFVRLVVQANFLAWPADT